MEHVLNFSKFGAGKHLTHESLRPYVITVVYSWIIGEF